MNGSGKILVPNIGVFIYFLEETPGVPIKSLFLPTVAKKMIVGRGVPMMGIPNKMVIPPISILKESQIKPAKI